MLCRFSQNSRAPDNGLCVLTITVSKVRLAVLRFQCTDPANDRICDLNGSSAIILILSTLTSAGMLGFKAARTQFTVRELLSALLAFGCAVPGCLRQIWSLSE